jgi:ketosteroid isomerase-like protein
VTRSPLERFLCTFDRLDADACAAMFAPDGRLVFLDGRAERGTMAVRDCLDGYFADLRSTEHVIRGLWQIGDVWIAEVEAAYVLADHSRLGPVSKVFVMRMRDSDIADLRVYAAGVPSFHEAALRRERERARGDLVRGRWIPPL